LNLRRFAGLAALAAVLLASSWAAGTGGGVFPAVDFRDAGAYSIDAPSGDSVPPGLMSPRGTVRNYGDSAVEIPAQFDIYKILLDLG